MMKIQDIENLSAAEIKGLVASAIDEDDILVIKARYLKARFDASSRDEKLSEQGKTITLLQDAAGESAAREKSLVKDASELRINVSALVALGNDTNADHVAKIERMEINAIEEIEKASQQLAAVNDDLVAVGKSLTAQTQRAERFKSLAVRTAKGVSSAGKILNDLTAEMQVDAAEGDPS